MATTKTAPIFMFKLFLIYISGANLSLAVILSTILSYLMMLKNGLTVREENVRDRNTVSHLRLSLWVTLFALSMMLKVAFYERDIRPDWATVISNNKKMYF